MSECCAECNTKINKNEPNIGCYGVCGKKYHTKCLSESNPYYEKIDMVSILTHFPNLQWYCNDCLQFTLEGAFNGILRKLNDCSVAVSNITQPIKLRHIQRSKPNTSVAFASDSTPSRSAHHQIHQQNMEASVSLSTQTPLLLEKHHKQQRTQSDTVDLTSLQHNSSNTNSQTSTLNGMAMDTHNDQHHSSNTAIEIINSQKRKISPNILTPKRNKHANESLSQLVFVGNPYPKLNLDDINKSSTRSIYISRFKPITESSDILNHIDKITGMENLSSKISCTKLVSNKKRVKSLSFVSFKLTVTDELYELLSSPSIWPPSINAKDFKNIQKSQPSNSISNANRLKSNPNKPNFAKKNSKNFQTPINTPKRKRIQWRAPMGHPIQGIPQLQPQLSQFNPHPYYHMIPFQYQIPNQFNQPFGNRN